MHFNRVLKFGFILVSASCSLSAFAGDKPTIIPDQVRHDLLAARDAAWRSFFADDPAAAIEKTLDPEVIAIQENQEKWETRSHLIAVAKGMQKQGIKLVRLEFPRTEIQLFGDTAILYYTYIIEEAAEGKSSGVDAGRGTEVFVRRDGRWIDVGWHLDSGAFVMKDGHWSREGEQPLPGNKSQ